MRDFMSSLWSSLVGTDKPPTPVEAAPVRKLNRRFRRRRQHADDGVPAPPTSADSAPIDNVPPGMAATLRRIFDGRDPAQAGSIHLLGLDSIRDRMGDRWTQVVDRVHQLAEKLLTGHLSPQDAWFRHGDETYVVIFAHLGPDRARLVCAKVVEELQRLLLGDVDTASIVVHTALHNMGSDTMFVPANLDQMLNSAARKVPATSTPTVAWPLGAGTHRPLGSETAGPLRIRYRPVWDVRQQVLSVYKARCCRDRPGRAPLLDYECLDDPADGQAILELDMRVANEAVDVALELYDNRFRFFLSLPVHVESLAVLDRRHRLVRTLRAIPAHLRPFMTYHLYGVPPGMPSGRLLELASAVKPFGRTVLMEMEMQVADLAAAGAAGVRVACVTLPAGASVERWRHDLTRFGTAAARHHLRAAVEGVDNLALEDLCEEAGIGFLSGDLIGDWVDVPEHVVRKSRTDFIRQKPVIDRSRL